ncbi:MAG: hypothetical protein IJY15_10965, partial [Thermoguttaceae bacterium]|nr:hypothetical protein [Thermoguttaceae bacterium]
MTNKCDKCGATTRWYDERCPACGAVRTVALPTTPISLPRFAPSVVAELPPNGEVAQEKQTAKNGEVAQEKQTAKNGEVAREKQTAKNGEVAREKQTAQNGEVAQEKQTAPSRFQQRLAQLK